MPVFVIVYVSVGVCVCESLGGEGGIVYDCVCESEAVCASMCESECVCKGA